MHSFTSTALSDRPKPVKFSRHQGLLFVTMRVTPRLTFPFAVRGRMVLHSNTDVFAEQEPNGPRDCASSSCMYAIRVTESFIFHSSVLCDFRSRKDLYLLVLNFRHTSGISPYIGMLIVIADLPMRVS